MKNHVADPGIGFLAKSNSKSATAMPTAWELNFKTFINRITVFLITLQEFSWTPQGRSNFKIQNLKLIDFSWSLTK